MSANASATVTSVLVLFGWFLVPLVAALVADRLEGPSEPREGASDGRAASH